METWSSLNEPEVPKGEDTLGDLGKGLRHCAEGSGWWEIRDRRAIVNFN